jgi:hypothetical protein
MRYAASMWCTERARPHLAPPARTDLLHSSWTSRFGDREHASPFSFPFFLRSLFFFSLASLMPDNVVTEARIAHCPRRIREKKVREQSSSDHAEVAPCGLHLLLTRHSIPE